MAGFQIMETRLQDKNVTKRSTENGSGGPTARLGLKLNFGKGSHGQRLNWDHPKMLLSCIFCVNLIGLFIRWPFPKKKTSAVHSKCERNWKVVEVSTSPCTFYRIKESKKLLILWLLAHHFGHPTICSIAVVLNNNSTSERLANVSQNNYFRFN